MGKYNAEMGSDGNFAVVIIWKVEYNVCTFVRKGVSASEDGTIQKSSEGKAYPADARYMCGKY